MGVPEAGLPFSGVFALPEFVKNPFVGRIICKDGLKNVIKHALRRRLFAGSEKVRIFATCFS